MTSTRTRTTPTSWLDGLPFAPVLLWSPDGTPDHPLLVALPAQRATRLTPMLYRELLAARLEALVALSARPRATALAAETALIAVSDGMSWPPELEDQYLETPILETPVSSMPILRRLITDNPHVDMVLIDQGVMTTLGLSGLPLTEGRGESAFLPLSSLPEISPEDQIESLIAVLLS